MAARSEIERDLRSILAVQALRAFAYGFASVLLGASLADGGFSPTQVGLVFTSMLAGNAIVSIAVGTFGERAGRRRLYALLLALMGVAGSVYAFVDSLWILVLVALTGTLSTDPNESGPITSIEQAMMGSSPRDVRAQVFGRYNAIAYLAGAAGALAAGGPELLRRSLPSLPTDQRWLLLFAVVALGGVAISVRLSPAVESGVSPTGRPLQRSRSTVARLAALFGLDAFAGGFVVSTFVAYWFSLRFGTNTETIGAVLFGVGILQAASSVVSGRLAGRIGLLNTMVFTHLPSNIMLALIPLMPSLELAVAMLLLRSTLSQMDVPARQAYVVTMVHPSERTAATAFTNTARYLVRPFGAAASGLVMQRIALGAPFVIAGTLKVVYDLALYATFRRIPLPEEAETATPSPPR